MVNLWVESYRPKTFDEYVWTDENRKKQFQEIVKSGSLPNLLLTGSPGSGKTSLARLLLKELQVQPGDILEVNASVENGIEVIRNKITNFASTLGFGDIRYILLDEADYLSPNALAGLRNLIEQFHETARFILTANAPQKIIPAIKSRCQHYQFEKLNLDEFTLRAATILAEEGITFDIETLDTYVKGSYPDLRKCINLLQQYSVNETLTAPTEAVDGTTDYMVNAVALFKDGKITEGRKVIIENANPDEYTDIYRFLYQNLELWSDDDLKQKKALLVIAKGLRNHSLVADPEINLSATICELELLE